MRLLVDTNVFVEGLLNQERADTVRSLLLKASEHEFLLTEFSLYSIGIILIRHKRYELLHRFLADTVIAGKVTVLRLAYADLQGALELCQRFNLDFDDAYQYAAAEKYDLTIVSFDADFDRAERGRKVPAQIG